MLGSKGVDECDLDALETKGVDARDLDVPESEGVDDRTEDNCVGGECRISLSECSLPEFSDSDITPEQYSTLRPMDGFSCSLCRVRRENLAEGGT